jgi:hypothetical protein
MIRIGEREEKRCVHVGTLLISPLIEGEVGRTFVVLVRGTWVRRVMAGVSALNPYEIPSQNVGEGTYQDAISVLTSPIGRY